MSRNQRRTIAVVRRRDRAAAQGNQREYARLVQVLRGLYLRGPDRFERWQRLWRTDPDKARRIVAMERERGGGE